MKQITIRGFDNELAQRLKKLAETENLSLNKAVLKLLRKATGLENTHSSDNTVAGALDDFIGIWSDEERRQFDQSIEAFEKIDDPMWS
ncbi:MAG: antitoxin [Proteobacteria bacterium]|nr:antitoxin [Pseudomonadota bacterium]